jgi:hypothetical protein
MSPENSSKPLNPQPASTGNASNPNPRSSAEPNNSQLLDDKAEKYLREGGNIEDMPDAEEEGNNQQGTRKKE